MKIDRALILKLEKLSKLSLSEKEREEMTGELEAMLGMVDKLSEADTEGVEPLVHVLDAVNVLRNDEPGEPSDRSEVLDNAPKADGEFFLVPNMMKDKKT